MHRNMRVNAHTHTHTHTHTNTHAYTHTVYRPCSVSGAMKAGVPAVLDRKASLPSNSLLTPKSAI